MEYQSLQHIVESSLLPVYGEMFPVLCCISWFHPQSYPRILMIPCPGIVEGTWMTWSLKRMKLTIWKENHRPPTLWGHTFTLNGGRNRNVVLTGKEGMPSARCMGELLQVMVAFRVPVKQKIVRAPKVRPNKIRRKQRLDCKHWMRNLDWRWTSFFTWFLVGLLILLVWGKEVEQKWSTQLFLTMEVLQSFWVQMNDCIWFRCFMYCSIILKIFYEEPTLEVCWI